MTPTAHPEKSFGPAAWVSAAFLLTVLVLGTVMFVTNKDSDSPAASTNESSNTPSVATPAKGQPVSDAIPLTAPKVQWENFNTVWLPSSEEYGPWNRNPPIISGYSHTPTGALIAMAQIGYRYGVTGEGWQEVVNQQILPGKGRDVVLQYRTDFEKRHRDNPVNIWRPQLAGYRFVTYSPEVAVIQTVNTTKESGTWTVITSTVKWVNNDWRLELQEDGGMSPTANLISNLDGYIPWGATNG